MTIGILGGMIIPKIPDAATSATEKFLSYPFSSMAGIIIEPMEATVAGADPDIAPKNMHVTTVTIAKPPVNCPISESQKPTRRLERPPPSINAPERIKPGIASRGKESHVVNILLAKYIGASWPPVAI